MSTAFLIKEKLRHSLGRPSRSDFVQLEIHIFELPKLKKYEYPETELLNWMRFMNAEKKEEFEMLAKKDEYMGKAYERLTKLSADEQKRLEYEAREKAERDYRWQMKTSYSSGYKEGSIKTFVEDCKEFGVPKDEALKRFMAKFSLEYEEAEKYVKEYWK